MSFEAKLDSVNALVKQINRKLEDVQVTVEDVAKTDKDISERFNEFYDRIADMIFDINHSVEDWMKENIEDGSFDNAHNGATLDNTAW